MNPCLAFFRQHHDNKQKIDLLLLEPDRIAWEALTASEHSPGPVANDEVIFRQMLQPIHIQDDGDISPAAFSDVMDKGLSTDRRKFRDVGVSVNEGISRAEAHNAEHPDKPKREFFGLAPFDVSYIRSVTAMNSSERALAVYDSAEEFNAAHADVCMVVEKTTSNKRSVRSKLYDAAKRAGFIK